MAEFEVGDSYYDVLDIPSSASDSEIKNAWVKKTKDIHADKTGDSERYEYLLDAGQVLRDSEKREAYDVLGHEKFIEHYGRRGDKNPINPSDWQDTNTNESENNTSTTSTNSTDTNSTSSSSTSDTRTSESSSESKWSSTNSSSQSSGSSSQTSTSTSTGQNNTSTSTASSSQNNSKDTRSSSESESSNEAEQSTGESVYGEDTSFLNEITHRWLIDPAVSYPVSTRLFGVMLPIVLVWGGSELTGYGGTGFDLLAMFALATVGLFSSHWVPERYDRNHPEISTWLVTIPVRKLAVAMLAATGVAALGDFAFLSMFEMAMRISISIVIALIGITLIFAGIGVVVGIASYFVGTRVSILWTSVGFGALAFILTVIGYTTTMSDPREPVLVDAAQLSINEYPWPMVEAAPEFIIHGPIFSTILLSFFLTTAVFVGVPMVLLALLHDPAQHASYGRYIRPTLWEASATIVPITLIWSLLHAGPDTPLELLNSTLPHITQEVIMFEGLWLTVVTLITLFAIRTSLEPRYSQWRDS